jgi:hypothetical protein
MSATEILSELASLPVDELQAVWREAAGLLERTNISGSPELLAAIDEGDASFTRETPVNLKEAQQIARSWNTT